MVIEVNQVTGNQTVTDRRTKDYIQTRPEGWRRKVFLTSTTFRGPAVAPKCAIFKKNSKQISPDRPRENVFLRRWIAALDVPGYILKIIANESVNKGCNLMKLYSLWTRTCPGRGTGTSVSGVRRQTDSRFGRSRKSPESKTALMSANENSHTAEPQRLPLQPTFLLLYTFLVLRSLLYHTYRWQPPRMQTV